MFEKDAKKWVKENIHIEHSASFGEIKVYPSAENGFQAGAEFGYNKCKEDAYKMKSRFLELCNMKDMRIEELEKANEWHYVKDKDYPKDNKPVLCILGDINSDNCEVGYYNDVGSGEPWHFETYHLPDDDGDNAWGVSAWKEIVLPKESE